MHNLSLIKRFKKVTCCTTRMSELTDILRRDLRRPGIAIKNLAIGAIKGFYTPFVLDSSIRNAIDDYDNTDILIESTYEYIEKDPAWQDNIIKVGSKYSAQCITFCFSSAYIINLSIESGKGLEFLAIITGTNVINYLVNSIKRSRTAPKSDTSSD